MGLKFIRLFHIQTKTLDKNSTLKTKILELFNKKKQQIKCNYNSTSVSNLSKLSKRKGYCIYWEQLLCKSSWLNQLNKAYKDTGRRDNSDA
jgi:hypothetical protein